MKSLLTLGLVMEALAGVLPPQVTANSTKSLEDAVFPYSTTHHPEPTLTVASSSSNSTTNPTETTDWLQRPETKTYVRNSKLYAQTTMPASLSTSSGSARATPKWGAEPIRNPKTGVIHHAFDVLESTLKSGVAKEDTTIKRSELDERLVPEGLKEAWHKIKVLIAAGVIKSKGPFIGDLLIPNPEDPNGTPEKKPSDGNLVPEDLKEAWHNIKALIAAGVIKSKGPLPGDLLIPSPEDPKVVPRNNIEKKLFDGSLVPEDLKETQENIEVLKSPENDD